MTTTPEATAGAAEATETGGATEQTTATIVGMTVEMTDRTTAEMTAVMTGTQLGDEAADQDTDRRTSSGHTTTIDKVADASGIPGASSPEPPAATSAKMTAARDSAGPRPTTGYPEIPKDFN